MEPVLANYAHHAKMWWRLQNVASNVEMCLQKRNSVAGAKVLPLRGRNAIFEFWVSSDPFWTNFGRSISGFFCWCGGPCSINFGRLAVHFGLILGGAFGDPFCINFRRAPAQLWACGDPFWHPFWINFALDTPFWVHFGRPGGWLRGSILDQFWALNFGIIFRRPADLFGAFAGLEHCDENMLTRVNRAMAFHEL